MVVEDRVEMVYQVITMKVETSIDDDGDWKPL
jgi:hypothetical protein